MIIFFIYDNQNVTSLGIIVPVGKIAIFFDGKRINRVFARDTGNLVRKKLMAQFADRMPETI